MKKFLIGAILLLFVGLCFNYAVFHVGFYLDWQPDAPVTAPFRTEQKQLLRVKDDGTYEPFRLRGVDISASLPGHYATSFAATEDDYLRWFEAIADMGANALRATNVMDDAFYNALYTYNTTHPEPLYLLQGTSVSDYANNNAKDAYHDDFLAALLEDGKDLVDIIHGRKTIPLNEMRGSGLYRRDISSWVVGFVIGTEWVSDTVAYTDHNIIRSQSYQGTYFTTRDDATAFEAMLAQVMDEVTLYESKKYKTQRPIGFINDPANDFLAYEPVYARQLQKYVQIDAEHVLPTDALLSGYFAAYRLYDFCPNFTQYLSQEQKMTLAPLLENLSGEGLYGGYLELIAAYHTMPVLAAGYGFSSSRGAVKIDWPPLTEEEQGQRLVAVSQELAAEGWAGDFISTWQDTWERRTWNTAFATVPTQNYRWHDLQTDGQGYGLLSFTPGEAGPICLLDGNAAEWADVEPILQEDGVTLSAQYDAEGIYLLLEKEGLSPEEHLYIPIDIAPDVGSQVCAQPALTFERNVDFLLCLTGTENSRLLVQERYDAMRENFLFEITGVNPYIYYPEQDSSIFVPIQMALENDLILDVVTPETRALQRLGTWETGKLLHGNGNPAAANYFSLADFCYGENCVEIRLPWLLLNVADPSAMQVHCDYYQHYGVETQTISQIWFGVSLAGEETIAMQPYSVKGWGRQLTWQERLKQSYYVVQAQWKGGGADATEH